MWYLAGVGAAVGHGAEYTPAEHAVTAPALPIYIGARGERFNRFASAEADGRERRFLTGLKAGVSTPQL